MSNKMNNSKWIISLRYCVTIPKIYADTISDKELKKPFHIVIAIHLLVDYFLNIIIFVFFSNDYHVILNYMVNQLTSSYIKK